MSNRYSGELNDCGCCEGLNAQTPEPLTNPPGLSTVAYRVGTHSTFNQTMLARLSSEEYPPLAELRTRDTTDFAIGMIDAWSTVSDILAFYQERLANESYLRTATERLSVVELARLIGYRPKPGVAASAYLAFKLDDSAGALRTTTIGIGVKAQSIPGPDEKPQTFESVEKIVARVDWNSIRPRLTKPQFVSLGMNSMVFEGTATQLRSGDALIIVESNNDQALNFVRTVQLDTEKQTTLADMQLVSASVSSEPTVEVPPEVGVVFSQKANLTDTLIENEILNKTWNSADLLELAEIQGWSIDELREGISNLRAQSNEDHHIGVFVFRKRAAIFGHNAPLYESLPTNMRVSDFAVVRDSDGNVVRYTEVLPAYPDSWEGRNLDFHSGGAAANVYLDRVYSEIIPGSWLALQSENFRRSYRVVSQAELTLSDYGMSSKVSRLTLDRNENFDDFSIRETTVFAQSEKLVLAELPITSEINSNMVTLDDYYPYLSVGQRVIVNGNPAEEPGKLKSEIKTLAAVSMIEGFTTIRFVEPLARSYIRESFTINANVTLATHGETVREVLGSGSASLEFQKMALRRPPLTYVSAATPRGTESTLTVRVNDVRWQEVSMLFGQGPADRVFSTRENDQGQTTVEFGNGDLGARLQTGQDNVRVDYRTGIGLEGMVGAGQLSMLLAPPLGVKEVTNPLPASGADDPESLESARLNAPLPMLTMGRAVSLRDYEDFARAFAGIAKAFATWAWQGDLRIILLTVAGPDGEEITAGGSTHNNLFQALRNSGDPLVGFRIQSYRRALFRLEGKIKIHPDYLPEKVQIEIEQSLKKSFSFDARSFGQPVNQSEVVAVIQNVIGVVAVDLDKLYRSDALVASLNVRIVAESNRPGSDGDPLAAELLTLDPLTLERLEMSN